MIIRDIFKTGVAEIKLNLDLNKLKKFCLDYQKNNQGRNRSNPTGYQSHDVLNFKETKELVNEIKKYSGLFLKDNLLNISNHKLNHMWFNINYYKDFNTAHCHSYNKVSGVFYVSTPKNCGNIIFKNPAPIENFLPLNDLTEDYNNYNSTSWYLPALENYLYIFPSWLYHHVEPNLSKQPRISFSFNVN